MFSVCEASSYLWNSFVYIGKYAVETPEEKALVKQLGKSNAVISQLMNDLFGYGCHLYVDNSLREKCPNTEYFLVRIFLYSV